MSTFAEAFVFLAAAVVIVPLFKKWGLGTVLGYIAAGLLVGPFGLQLVSDVESVLHFAELGVVFLLFVIGLELQPRRLWALRKPVFGLGGLQVSITSVLLSLGAWLLGVEPITAIVIGLGLSMSSTAFVLQTLSEKNQLITQHGRSSFAILLFQDVAVIPLLAIIPLLGTDVNQVAQANSWLSVANALGIVTAVIVGGHFLLRPFFRIIASSQNHELFTAAALLVVVGTALLMDFAGLSMALGSFIAGVLLADSEYRHELSANIEPFKGLLLGLFFIAVGMSIDLSILSTQPLSVIGLTLALVTIKFCVVYFLGKQHGHDALAARKLAATISQGGEFAFVLYAQAVSATVMPSALADMLTVIVALSMALTPIILTVEERFSRRAQAPSGEPDYDTIEEEENPVVLAGFGRFGQITARILTVRGIPFTALEKNQTQVDFVRRFGGKVYYGDASRLDMLRAARVDKAKAFVLTVRDIDASLKIVELVRTHFPHVVVLARARNRQHVYQLRELGVHYVTREMFFSSLELTQRLLVNLEFSREEASAVVQRFQAHDIALMDKQQQFYRDEEQLIASARQASAELLDLFQQDAQSTKDRS